MFFYLLCLAEIFSNRHFMRISVLLFVFFFISFQTYAQQQVQEWLDKNWRPISDSEKGEHFRIVTKDSTGKLNGPVTEYYSVGKKRMMGNFANGKESGDFEYFHLNGQLDSKGKYIDGERVGKWQEWYTNGQIRQQGYYVDNFNKTGPIYDWHIYRIENFWDSTGVQHVKNGTGNWLYWQQNGKISAKGQYKNGQKDGEWMYYREDGSVENREEFSPEGLVIGTYYAPDGSTQIYDNNSFEKMPEFPGGVKAFYGFLNQNIKYPKEARKKRIIGTVYIGFVVGYNGVVRDVTILKGIGGGCDEEAARVISIMPQWVPGRQRGKAVSVRYSLPIKFGLM